MIRTFALIAVMLLSLFPLTRSLEAVDIKAPAVPPVILPPLPPFDLAIKDYFKVPGPEIMNVRERHIPDEQIPVVFFLAQMAHVAPRAILDLRLGGRSWMDISLHFGLDPGIFHVPVREVVKGPPYGKAYGYYKNKPKKEWKKMKLDDDEVVNLVNLRFLSEHHRYSPEDIIRLRSEGKSFISIDQQYREEKVRRERGKHKDDRDRGERGNDHGRDRYEKREGKGHKNKN